MSKLRKEKGIVLRSFKYGETSLILDILTENFGLKSFIIQSVRKAKSRTSPSSVQLMAAVDIDFYLKEDTELFQLKEIRSNRLWISIYSDMRKIAMSMYMAEVTRKVVNKYENHIEIYDLLSLSLEQLENSHHAWSLHLWYTVHLKVYSGFSLIQKKIGSDQFYDIRSGDILNVPPNHGFYFDEKMMQLLRELEQLPIEQIDEVIMGRNLKNNMLDNLLEYFKIHIHNFNNIQSLDVLKTVFE